MTTQSSPWRALVEFLVIAVCTLTFVATLLGVISTLFGADAAGSHDYVEYWASGHQLVQHANPYDAGALLKLERSVGFPPKIPALIMGNPPSALLITLPLGLLSADAGNLMWLLLLVLCLVASVWMIRAINGAPKNLIHLLGLSFAPALSCLVSGQVTVFMLLGLVMFLRFHRKRPFVAGAALWFCLLKPHLFLPFGVVLVLWIVRERSYKILAGAASAIAVSSVIATIFDPLVWVQYSHMMRETRLDRAPMPCLGSLLRQYVPPHTLWLQCLPAAIGCLWAIRYFLKHRNEWNWMEHGSLVMLVSVFVAPYTWFMDQTVLIPALLGAAYQTRSRTLISILALMTAVIEIELLARVPLLHSEMYVWAAPGWLVWYLFAMKSRPKAQDQGASGASPSLANA